MVQDRWIENQVDEIRRGVEYGVLEVMNANYVKVLINNFGEMVKHYVAIAQKIENIRNNIRSRELRRALHKLPHPSGNEFGKTVAIYYAALDVEVKKQLPILSKINPLIEALKEFNKIRDKEESEAMVKNGNQ